MKQFLTMVLVNPTKFAKSSKKEEFQGRIR